MPPRRSYGQGYLARMLERSKAHPAGDAPFLTMTILLFAACSPAQPGVAHIAEHGTPVSAITSICDMHWTTTNLDATTYRNGDHIPQVTDPAAWAHLTTGAWCWYNNDSAAYHHHGRLYNWYAVNDPRGLAPQGWHVLTDAEWQAMEACLGEDSIGYRMRAAGAGQWPGPATNADNSSGFNGLPSGTRSSDGVFAQGDTSAVYWTSVEGSASEAWCGRLIHVADLHGAPAMVTGVGYMSKTEGYAVRCVKDR